MTMHTPRILVIDDQMDSIALLLNYFRGQPFDIQIARSGEDGLRKAISGLPDVILLDVAMPGMDGYDVCRHLKSDPRTAAAPVLFLSANTTVAHRLEGFAAGGVDYIGKPFSAEEVMARLYVHLRLSQRVERLEAVAAGNGQAAAAITHADQLVAATIAQLQRDDAEWPGLPELAWRIGSNEKKLTQLFRQHFGLTVHEYFIELRLEKARQHLASTRLQVQLIAEQAGYGNASDFSRAFRRRYGIGPREYRKAGAQTPQEPA